LLQRAEVLNDVLLYLVVWGHAEGELALRANETACVLDEAPAQLQPKAVEQRLEHDQTREQGQFLFVKTECWDFVEIRVRLCFTGLHLRWPFLSWVPGWVLHLFYPIETGRRKLFRALAAKLLCNHGVDITVMVRFT
jgi:hypothetical protein